MDGLETASVAGRGWGWRLGRMGRRGVADRTVEAVDTPAVESRRAVMDIAGSMAGGRVRVGYNFLIPVPGRGNQSA